MKRSLGLGAVVVAGALVTGCSSSSSGLGSAAGSQLQADVAVLTQTAAAHDWSAARSSLARLRADLVAARTAGSVSDERAAAIQSAVTAVAADLTAAGRSSEPTVRPSPPPTKVSTHSSTTASTPTDPVPAPIHPAPAPKHKPKPKPPKHGKPGPHG